MGLMKANVKPREGNDWWNPAQGRLTLRIQFGVAAAQYCESKWLLQPSSVVEIQENCFCVEF